MDSGIAPAARLAYPPRSPRPCTVVYLKLAFWAFLPFAELIRISHSRVSRQRSRAGFGQGATLPFSGSVVHPQIAERVLRAGQQVLKVDRHLVHVFVVAENFDEDAAFAFAVNPAQPVIAIAAS
jgi:hypothetical protein